MKLAGKGVLVTGASRGLGRAIAVACAAAGADVALTGRDVMALEESAALAKAACHDDAQCVVTSVGNVADPDTAARHVKDAIAGMRCFTGVVNNAGVYGPMGRFDSVDWDKWRECVEINLFGVALMCHAALSVLSKSGGGAILNLSGGGATAPLPFISAYAAGKAAVVRLTETLAHEYASANITVNALAPGALNTEMLQQALDAGPNAVGADFYAKAVKQLESGGTPVEYGADLAVWAMSEESRGITGRLLSAVWDPWKTIASRADSIRNTDIYTLRRIVPKDRGQDWGDK